MDVPPALFNAEPARATPITRAIDQQADQNLKNGRADNAHLNDAHTLRTIDLGRVVETDRGKFAHYRDDDGDIAKTGAVIHRYPALRDQQRRDGAETACKQCHADVELGQDRDQHGGREHRQHLLEAKTEQRADRRRVVRHITKNF
jgi:hypothetical protein